MSEVIFYEKPSCINNAKQKAILRAAGHSLNVRNLLTTIWTVESLRPFFVNREVAAWFNMSSPRIKSGEIRPDKIDGETALKLMVDDPLLIRRPLIEVGDRYMVGFDIEKLDACIGLGETIKSIGDVETCPNLVAATGA